MNTKIFIGIAGGTASGKSAIARHLMNYFKHNICATIKVDSYYHDLKHLSMQEREKINFDSPESIDFNFLLDHITKLNNDEPVKVPIYDYKTHTRKKNNVVFVATFVISNCFCSKDFKIKCMAFFVS